jgi:hypothetical protein
MQDRFSHSGVDEDSSHLEYLAMPASKWLHIFKEHGAAIFNVMQPKFTWSASH